MSKILATLWFKWINQRQKIASLSRCINHVVKFKRYLHLGIAVSNFKSIVELSIFDLKVWKSQPKETKVFFKNAYMRIKVTTICTWLEYHSFIIWIGNRLTLEIKGVFLLSNLETITDCTIFILVTSFWEKQFFGLVHKHAFFIANIF